MFSGIVEEVGRLHSLDQSGDAVRLAVKARLVLEDLSGLRPHNTAP